MPSPHAPAELSSGTPPISRPHKENNPPVTAVTMNLSAGSQNWLLSLFSARCLFQRQPHTSHITISTDPTYVELNEHSKTWNQHSISYFRLVQVINQTPKTVLPPHHKDYRDSHCFIWHHSAEELQHEGLCQCESSLMSSDHYKVDVFESTFNQHQS